MKLMVCRTLALLALCAFLFPAGPVSAQRVTTGAIAGVVTDPRQHPIPGATVVALHEPSGSKYEAVTRADRTLSLPGMRIGGPYTVTVSTAGFQPQVTKEVFL